MGRKGHYVYAAAGPDVVLENLSINKEELQC